MNRNSPDVVDSVELKLQRSMSSVKHQFGGSITPKSESKHKIVQKFLDRNTSSMNVVQDAKGRFGSTSHRKKVSSMNVREDTYQPFAQRFQNFTVRDFRNNTRMNIKNVDYSQAQEKRDRAINYWQNQVIQNHLPPISKQKQEELQALRRMSTRHELVSRKPEFQISMGVRRRESENFFSQSRGASSMLQNTLALNASVNQ